jgi:hypothetical protein
MECQDCTDDEGVWGKCPDCAMVLCDRCLQSHRKHECPCVECGRRES